MKKTITILTALASLTIAHAETQTYWNYKGLLPGIQYVWKKLCPDGILRAQVICSWTSEYLEYYPEAVYIQSSTDYVTHFWVLGKTASLGPMAKAELRKD